MKNKNDTRKEDKTDEKVFKYVKNNRILKDKLVLITRLSPSLKR